MLTLCPVPGDAPIKVMAPRLKIVCSLAVTLLPKSMIAPESVVLVPNPFRFEIALLIEPAPFVPVGGGPKNHPPGGLFVVMMVNPLRVVFEKFNNAEKAPVRLLAFRFVGKIPLDTGLGMNMAAGDGDEPFMFVVVPDGYPLTKP